MHLITDQRDTLYIKKVSSLLGEMTLLDLKEET